MRQVNTFSLGAASGAVGRLQREINFPAGQQATQLDLEIALPVRNTGGAPITLKAADLAKVFAAVVATFSLRFGKKSPEIIDNALSFGDARRFFQVLTGRDFQINGVPLATFDTEVPAGIVIAAGATTIVELVFCRAFTFDRLGVERNKFCPGTTQMRQMQIEVMRGAATLGVATGLTISQPDAADVTVLAHHVREEAEDQWSPIIRWFTNAESGLESAGPNDAGVILAVMETTAAGAATEIELFTLGRDGDEPIHDNVQASRVVRQGRYDLPIGAIDPNDTATVLYQPPERCRLEELPLGRGFYVRQAANYLTPMQTAWIYVPEMDRARADSYVGPNAANEMGEVKLSSLGAVGATAQLAAVLPVSLLRRGSIEFAIRPGATYAKDVSAPTIDIPEAVRDAAVAQVQAQSGTAAQTAALSTVATMIGKYLPGGTASARGVLAGRAQELVTGLAGAARVPELGAAAALTLRTP